MNNIEQPSKMEKEIYILMFKNDEVLSFEVTFGEYFRVKIIDKLAHYEKAPLNISKCETDEQRNAKLFKFFYSRTIASTRYDYEDILKATNCRDSFELSFKGHGLSLANHYWFKKENENLRYEDINFFTNKWDDSFARAVLNGDYEALKNADLNVPDIVTPGWAVKGWLCEKDGPTLYKFSISKNHYEEQLGETLASSLGRKLLADEVLEYKLIKVNDNYASTSKCMINIDEELIPLADILSKEFDPYLTSFSGDHEKIKSFLNKLLETGYKDIYQHYVKILVLKTLVFANDFHFNNISIIRNINTGKIRMAPIYDLGGAFGGSENGRKLLSNVNSGLLFILLFSYGMLEPDWDYSWFDSSKLHGFENEIRNTLSKSEFYNQELLDNIIYFYNYQKESLEKMAKRK